MSYFADYRDHVGTNLERFFKTTIFLSPHMLVGMDCLEPGQSQRPHQHAGHDKFYYVIEGLGQFTVGDETQAGQPGTIVWAPADTIHSVVNTGESRLVMLIGMAPEPK
jgi:quercetin dioxygenase-like cupin family protein